jgi:hypothetical protein
VLPDFGCRFGKSSIGDDFHHFFFFASSNKKEHSFKIIRLVFCSCSRQSRAKVIRMLIIVECCCVVCVIWYHLVPDLEETVPRSSTHCHAVLGDAQTTHSVVVASQDTGAFNPECVPNVDIEVIIAGHE